MLSMPSLICNNQDKNTKDLSLRYISLSSRPINSSMISSLLKYLRKVREILTKVIMLYCYYSTVSVCTYVLTPPSDTWSNVVDA